MTTARSGIWRGRTASRRTGSSRSSTGITVFLTSWIRTCAFHGARRWAWRTCRAAWVSSGCPTAPRRRRRQARQWSGPGTYIRARIEQYELDKVVHFGRIWRLVYDGVGPNHTGQLHRDPTVPHMNNETPAQLVAHLSHPNGWWRDTAQQLLV